MILEKGSNGEQEIANRTYKIAEILGLYVPCEFLVPMMISHMQDSESKNVPMYVTSCLTALGAVVKNTGYRYAA